MKFVSVIFVIIQGAALLYVLITSLILYVREKAKNSAGSRSSEGARCSTKILVIIPARNEEAFIKNTIAAIRNAEYPPELRDIVVLADHCADNTVNLAREENVVVYERPDHAYYTKGGILKSYFNRNKENISRYDYVCVIDADTIVDENFFAEADKAFKQGHKIVQGEVSVYTTEKNIISGFMVIYQAILNICFFRLLGCCNKSVLIAGKGMLFSPCIFNHIMWNEYALIEDVDISFQAILSGIPILYCDKIKVSSVQPGTFSGMWNQQRRWLSGQFMLIRGNFKNLVNGKLSGGTILFIAEGILCVAVFPVIIVTAICFFRFFYLILLYYIIAVFTAVMTIVMDGSQKQIGMKDILMFPFILAFWYVINIISFFWPLKFWK